MNAKPRNNLASAAGVFARGVCMGVADLVPGVSGGAIAFVTGIYDRLLAAVGLWSRPLPWNLLMRGKISELWRVAAVRDNVAPGSVLFTDENPVYKSLDGEDYMHHAVNHSANEYVRLMAHTNGIESVWAVMKRGIRGVYHQVSHKHLDKYVGEFTFRLNEGNVRRDTIDRLASLVSASAGKRLTWRNLTA